MPAFLKCLKNAPDCNFINFYRTLFGIFPFFFNRHRFRQKLYFVAAEVIFRLFTNFSGIFSRYQANFWKNGMNPSRQVSLFMWMAI